MPVCRCFRLKETHPATWVGEEEDDIATPPGVTALGHLDVASDLHPRALRHPRVIRLMILQTSCPAQVRYDCRRLAGIHGVRHG